MAKKKKNVNIPFTQEELDRIQNTPLRNLKDLAFMMKRSYDSVRRKKWALENKHRDLEKKKECRKKTNEEIFQENGGKKIYNYWSKDEIALLLNSNMPDTEIAVALKRSLGAVQTKRYYLNKERERKRYGR